MKRGIERNSCQTVLHVATCYAETVINSTLRIPAVVIK